MLIEISRVQLRSSASRSLRLFVVASLCTLSTKLMLAAPTMRPYATGIHTHSRTEITQAMIKNFMSPVADYGEAVEMAPGTFTTNGNGVGLGQSKTYFRGFPDGDYDIDFDGIPFYDTNTSHPPLLGLLPLAVPRRHRLRPLARHRLHHRPTPFGGSIHLLSKPFSPVRTSAAAFSYGSFNTFSTTASTTPATSAPAQVQLQRSTSTTCSPRLPDLQLPDPQRRRHQGPVQALRQDHHHRLLRRHLARRQHPQLQRHPLPDVRRFGCQRQLHLHRHNAPFAGSGINFLLTNNSDPLLYLDNSTTTTTCPPTSSTSASQRVGQGLDFDFKPYTYNYDNSEKYSNAVPITDNHHQRRHHLRALGVKIPPTLRQPGQEGRHRLRRRQVQQLPQVRRDLAAQPGLEVRHPPRRHVVRVGQHQPPPVPLRPPQNWADAGAAQLQEKFVTNSYQPFAEYEFHVTRSFPSLPASSSPTTPSAPSSSPTTAARSAASAPTTPPAFIANGGSYFATLPSVAGNYRIQNNWSAYAQYATGSIVPPSSHLRLHPVGTPARQSPAAQAAEEHHLPDRHRPQAQARHLRRSLLPHPLRQRLLFLHPAQHRRARLLPHPALAHPGC
jgi:iron complex outermembrane receptor protein